MRIVFIAPKFFPEIGGVEKHIQSVSKELTKLNHSVIVMTSTFRDNIKPFETYKGIQIYRNCLRPSYSPRLNSVINLMKSWIFFAKKFPLLVDCEIIHLHDMESFLWLLPLIPSLKILFRKRIFTTFHGFEGYPVSKLAIIIRKAAEKIGDGNICVGSYIVKWYGTKPDAVIVGGVDTERGFAIGAVKEGAVFIGRLAEDTGIMQYIEGLKILKDKYSIKMELCVCGDGLLGSKIHEFATVNGLEVFFQGFVEHPEEFLDRYRYAFVTGYLSILEAMLCKRLIFAIYGNELKKDYICSIPNAEALLFVSASPEELADNLYLAKSEPEQVESILKKARAFAIEQTWKKIATTYLELYEKKV
jgi:glycosyltransferase involved in cell wall biosynthesis